MHGLLAVKSVLLLLLLLWVVLTMVLMAASKAGLSRGPSGTSTRVSLLNCTTHTCSSGQHWLQSLKVPGVVNEGACVMPMPTCSVGCISFQEGVEDRWMHLAAEQYAGCSTTPPDFMALALQQCPAATLNSDMRGSADRRVQVWTCSQCIS
jgi:hypothetical protein